jgi:VCBS repeat-containing protein
VTINGTNDVPVVNDIDITVVQNNTVVIINADFSDVDVNDTHIITIDNSTTVGVVINNGDGTFSYDCGDAFIHLAVGETATDTFTYTIDDGNGGVITKTVTVTINGTNDVPVVNDIDITVVQNNTVVIINADFSDVDVNDTHIITIDNSTTVGVVINNGDGTFSYDCGDAFIHLAVGETATDTFTYTVNDGHGGVITKTVTVTINGTNDLPVVNDIDITVVRSNNVVIINADFSDVDVNDTHIITIDNSTTVGVVINNGDGTFSYVCGNAFDHLGTGETATDTFTYTVNDGNGGIVTKTVTITINGTDETPVVQGMIIIGDEHDNVLTGGQGNDTIQGKEGADVHNGGEGQDTAHYGNFSDLTSVSVINLADASENTGVATGDTYNSIENVIGSAGQDTIVGNSEANSLSGGRGDDVLVGGSGADILNGGSGTDTASYADFTDEAVSSRINLANSAQNTGVAAGDIYTSIENVIGSAGRDTILGNSYNNELSGGLSNDSLYGGLGNDTLKGGEGNDYLRGDADDDVLIGGLGDDNLQGGTGSDTYHYSLGDGNDTITETNSADQDRLILGEGITLENVQFTRVGRVVSRNKVTRENIDLELTFEDGSVLLIKDQFNANSNYGVEFIEFADGTVLSGYDILRAAYEDATEEADWLYGGSQDDEINGLGGNDIIVGGSGNDIIDGGEGNDTIRGEAGDDLLIGSEGNDGLYGGADNDTLKGGEGNDYLRGDAGDDVLIGGLGDDNLQGGTGSDTYHYSLGDGNDTITETNSADQDRLILGEGITLENVQFTRVGRVVSRNKVTRENIDLELTFEDGSVLLIKDQFNANSNYGVEFIEFADGTVLSGYDILRAAYEDATEEADWLYGGSQDDEINGLGGNDIITSDAGADTLAGGEGNDTLDGGVGNDTLDGGEGNDTLYGRGDNDTLTGGVGNDRLYGEAGDDMLKGGEGDDYLRGDSGNDTFQFEGAQFGNDTIADFDVSAETIQFDAAVFANFSELLEAASNVGSTVVIQLDEENSVTLNGVQTTSLQADNFEFMI